MTTSLLPVILSGGSGSRLWPLSREQYPKQLLPLVGGESMLQLTVCRLDGLPGIQPPLLVCNENHRFAVAEQLRQEGKQGQIVLEPLGRNTAPALTLAALLARRDDADPVMVVMPADHVILDEPRFREAVACAVTLAESGQAVTFGIAPDAPETGYGYIQVGEAVAAPGRAFVLSRFVEKPNRATAESYLDSGDYLWNSGIFVMKASVWLDALAQCRPDILEACRASVSAAKSDGDFVRVANDAFADCPSDSIDYAVMERLNQGIAGLPQGVVIPLDTGWSDVGSWDSLWNVLSKDEAGNTTRGDVLLEGCTNTLAFAQNRLVSCVGVTDLIVVETDDAILIAQHDAAQDVKKIVDRLKASQPVLTQLHRKVHRPWGWFDGVDAGQRFQVKRIVVKPGAQLSLQMHHHRAEHWIVVSGTARVTRGDEVFLVSENESTYIPLGVTHRLENPGKLSLEMIEVQSGSYLGEDDIVRFEDTYGR
ncbi:mannose-1-phosphate guanylyltransferase/mannose-6-phosphate isomerase [Ferribacterium limneticum]|uniref:mannose-1-phosphate guanylyltransferase/mannose-6-phosphate isomerase n=1 Tax=Ferribacterium limneticum TaxID=76259 RepID=UPI001CFA2B6A|nr:mannose-1-phosphate guanylyltransferase/mannose-6-phosphate isomerase [Ferribacterium limneticum]UCV29964.1 mannose-1-phosphate guanylyltransferase/mannose-6-phosphate isomerase [Ferribacterium limneticum]UCV33883.1 mannose-1-phosphate guanylyltransferase/mannose-6-phosphate isomerase [Ferribacterium limneticum]